MIISKERHGGRQIEEYFDNLATLRRRMASRANDRNNAAFENQVSFAVKGRKRRFKLSVQEQTRWGRDALTGHMEVIDIEFDKKTSLNAKTFVS